MKYIGDKAEENKAHSVLGEAATGRSQPRPRPPPGSTSCGLLPRCLGLRGTRSPPLFPGDAHLSRRRSATRVRVPVSAAMADAEPEAEDGSEDGGGGGGGQAPPGPGGSASRVAPLDPEQLRRVLEQVTKAQPPAERPPPPFVPQDAARRLRDAAQQAALQRGSGAQPPRPPRLLPPQVRRREGRGETEARSGAGQRRGRRGGVRPPESSGRPTLSGHRASVCSSCDAPAGPRSRFRALPAASVPPGPSRRPASVHSASVERSLGSRRRPRRKRGLAHSPCRARGRLGEGRGGGGGRCFRARSPQA